MCIGPHVKYCYNWQTLIKLEFSQQIFKNSQISNLIKEICPLGAEFYADGRTDRHDKANSSFLQFAKVPNNAPPLHRAIQDCSLLAFDLDVSEKQPLQSTHIIQVHLQKLASASSNPELPKYFNSFGKTFSRAEDRKPKLQYVRRCSHYETADIIITERQTELVRGYTSLKTASCNENTALVYKQYY